MSNTEAKVTDTRLSYSSATLIKNCQQKYYHHKIAGTARDADYVPNEDAFNVGKAFHFVLEENNHTEKDLTKLLNTACVEFNVEDSKAMIHAMLFKYLKLHLASGLTCIFPELEIKDDTIVGYIDAIMTEENGDWWIVDLKTASRFSDLTVAKLSKDVQLNLYSYFADKIAGYLELDIKKFRGARYRVTTKSTLKQRSTETYNDYVARMYKAIKSYDIVIPKEIMCAEETYNTHMQWHQFSMMMREGKLKPFKNYSYCDSFFRPCAFWSQCHGQTYTDSVYRMKMTVK